ncbi:MAG TPA: hypothetical protein VFF53_13030 [Geobacteraceae bacterium]|nr:hypothetical protein [Geobacteraceae bacterium]
MKKTMAGGEAPFRIKKASRIVATPSTTDGGCAVTPGDNSDKPPC